MDFIGACKYGSLDKVISLLDHGANIHAVNECALRLSAENGHLPVVQYLLEHGADIHATNNDALNFVVKIDLILN